MDNRLTRILGVICDKCPLCIYARNHPETVLGKLMHWHGKWCPAWIAQIQLSQQRELKNKQHPYTH